MAIQNKEDLIQHIHQGNCPQYIFFWGHQKPKSGVSKSCLSQWYESPFEQAGQQYLTAEHYMMEKKALLFEDHATAQKILNSKTPGEAKKLARKLSNFNEQRWSQEKFNIVVQGNLLKFSQHPDLKAFLLSTGERILVEASPADKIWGIGLAEDHTNANQPHLWNGLNLLGFALMQVRQHFQETAL